MSTRTLFNNRNSSQEFIKSSWLQEWQRRQRKSETSMGSSSNSDEAQELDAKDSSPTATNSVYQDDFHELHVDDSKEVHLDSFHVSAPQTHRSCATSSPPFTPESLNTVWESTADLATPRSVQPIRKTTHKLVKGLSTERQTLNPAAAEFSLRDISDLQADLAEDTTTATGDAMDFDFRSLYTARRPSWLKDFPGTRYSYKNLPPEELQQRDAARLSPIHDFGPIGGPTKSKGRQLSKPEYPKEETVRPTFGQISPSEYPTRTSFRPTFGQITPSEYMNQEAVGSTYDQLTPIHPIASRPRNAYPPITVPEPQSQYGSRSVSHSGSRSNSDPTITPTSKFQKSYKMVNELAILNRRKIVGANSPPPKGYQGNKIGKSYLAQCDNLPHHLNCSLWITNIPAHITPSEFVASLPFGKIYALHLNRPDAEHAQQAAKLVLCDPADAAHIFHLTRTSHIYLGGKRLNVKYNRKGFRQFKGIQSRTLWVTGPRDLMDVDAWIGFFKSACAFEVSDIRSVEVGEGNVRLEFDFLRVDGQSQMCFKMIMDYEELRDRVRVTYGIDPCQRRI
ncbi:hypothetical protein M7I_0948 [Glarea lozoyensis 74030]|uniref:RRM domain-containing protein n=1 Tax=Glarea lozoyensis (strain ATCC 74030 / MF5533) TaxID=1104152 RepID=H0EER6_GLAL7|nr:hypothetical protein M7I_0948 [Glarea lozoyensis 74030]